MSWTQKLARFNYQTASRRQIVNSIKLLIVVILSIILFSCETVSYYSQAARGQLALVIGREDIDQLLNETDLPDDLRHKLSLILNVREFAEEDLMLSAGGSYLTYVELDREHVVWNVFAAPEFSLQPVTWCYPVAGCVSYRGYFSEDAAIDFAAGIEKEGYDVYVSGVDAYSTLGWFDDSILSTVIGRADYRLAGLVFHELAHQLIYLPGDTTFNESFASFVEQEGVRRWLQQQGQAETIERATARIARDGQFVALVTAYVEKFSNLYQQEMAVEQKRQKKSLLRDELRRAYQRLKNDWDGYAGYDNWFERSLNNAQLSTVASYNDLVPAFERLLQAYAGDLSEFYSRVESLTSLSQEERLQTIDSF